MQYTIYSLGDPDFMIRVLNALASLSNGGTLATMMKIGILCGAIGGGLKAIFSAGKEFPLFHFFIAMLLGMTLFGPLTAVTVLVTPLNPVPGSIYGNGMTKIDHVPFGPAVTGFLLSNIGVGLTKTFESVFSTSGSGGGGASSSYSFGLSSGGFLQKIQLMDAPIQAMRSTGSGPGLPALESSLGYFMHDCTMNAKAIGKLNDSDMLNSVDVLTGLAGPTPLPALFTMTQIPVGGNMTTPLSQSVNLSCPDALTRLKSAFTDGVNVASYMDEALKPFASGTSTSATQDIVGAFSAVGSIHGQNVGNYMAGLMTAVMAVRSGGIGPVSGSQSALFSVATETAAEQRAYQAMGEENMFLRIMRPMTGFFESLIYALGPFMCFLIGLGPEGLRLITKYAALTLWVMLWFPMLAIINLYEETSIEHAVNLLSNAHNPQSLDSVLKMHDTIVAMLTTGSELAAATPALALAILYGGAVTASALQGKLSGGDHINEKLPAPDAQKDAPVFQPPALMTSDALHGPYRPGSIAGLPTISFSSAGSTQLASAHAELESSSSNYIKTIGSQLQSGTQDGQTFQHSFNTAMDNSSGTTRSDLVSLGKQYGLKFNENASTSELASTMVKEDGTYGSSGGAGASGAGLKAGLSVSESTSAVNSNTTTETGSTEKSTGRAISKDQRATFDTQLAKIIRKGIGDSKSTSGGYSEGLSNNLSFSKSSAVLDSATDSYTQTNSLVHTGVYSQTLDAQAVGEIAKQTSATSDDKGAALHSLFSSGGRGQAFEMNKKYLPIAQIPDPETRELAAGYMTLAGQGPGRGFLPQDAASVQDREKAFSMASDYVFSITNHGHSSGSESATANQHVTDHRVPTAGETIHSVDANAHPPTVTSSQVIANVASIGRSVSTDQGLNEPKSRERHGEELANNQHATEHEVRALDPRNPDHLSTQQKREQSTFAPEMLPTPAASH